MITNVQGIPPLVVTAVESSQTNIGEETNAPSDNVSLQTSAARAEEQRARDSQQESTAEAEGTSDSEALGTSADFTVISKRLQEMLSNNTSVQFSIDDVTKKIVLKILDSETNEVIRQIPAEESLKIAQFITRSFEQGQVTDAKI